MLNEKVKAEVKEYVESVTEFNSDFYDAVVIMPDDKEIYIMVFIPRYASPQGSYEPGWGPNMEGIRQELETLQALQGSEFTDDELDELEEYAWDIAMKKVEHTLAIWSQRYGAPIEYGTYTECTKEEFEQAVDYLLDAPEYQREDEYEYVLIDTRIKE